MSDQGNDSEAERGTVQETEAVSERGTVKWYSIAKGYGFIRRDGDEAEAEDVFVHHSEVPGGDDDALTEGERVSFELVESAKGLQARKIVREDD